MAAALLDVAEGRVPKDRLALKCLYEEMAGWPYLEQPPDAPTPSSSSSSGAEGASSAASSSAASASDYAALADGERLCLGGAVWVHPCCVLHVCTVHNEREAAAYHPSCCRLGGAGVHLAAQLDSTRHVTAV